MISKKAQIGTGMTWVVALVIIFFIMAMFMAGAAFLSKKTDKVGIDVSEQQVFVSLDRTTNLLSFASKNRQIISDWADDEEIITLQSMRLPEQNADVKKKYDDIQIAFVEVIKNFDLKHPFICLVVGDKNMIVENDGIEGISWRPVPPAQTCLTGFQSSPLYDEVFILSNENKLVRIIYRDETNYGM